MGDSQRPMRAAFLRKMLIAAALAGWPTAAAAAVDWQFIGREGADIVHYIDADSINRGGSVAAFWTMTVRGDHGKGGEVIERLGTAHCTDYAYRVIEERRNPETRLRQPTWVVVFRKAWRDFGPEHAVPEASPLRRIIDMACGKAEIAPIAFPAPPSPPPPPAEPEPPAVESPPSVEAIEDEAEAAPGGGAPASDRPAGPAAWVDLGASVTGQAILVDAASIEDAPAPTAWFRLINPDDEDPLPVSYRLRVDCDRRTITQLGLRKYDEQGGIAEEREFGEEGEGPMEVEAETVMEVAWLNLCTGGGPGAVRALAGLAPSEPPASEPKGE